MTQNEANCHELSRIPVNSRQLELKKWRLLTIGNAMLDSCWKEDASSPAAAISASDHGFERCCDWLTLRARACLDRLPETLPDFIRELGQYHAGVMHAAAAVAVGEAKAEAMLADGRRLVRQLRDHIFVLVRATGPLCSPGSFTRFSVCRESERRSIATRLALHRVRFRDAFCS